MTNLTASFSNNHPTTVSPVQFDGPRKLYYWCGNRAVPNAGFSFDQWSKQPNYWSGRLQLQHGKDYMTVLHMTASDMATLEGIDLNKLTMEAVERGIAYWADKDPQVLPFPLPTTLE